MGHDGSLLVSRPYVLMDGALIDPLEGNKNLHEPIKNSWLIKYDLPYWESDIKEQDTDTDGFSNLEEYLAGSDPRDKNSIPPFSRSCAFCASSRNPSASSSPARPMTDIPSPSTPKTAAPEPSFWSLAR